MIHAILAVDENLGFGYKGQLPWPRLKIDMDWFRSHTTNKNVLMGKRTFLSLNGPLLKRDNFILTSNPSSYIPNSFHKFVFKTSNIYEFVWRCIGDDGFVIGGEKVFNHVFEKKVIQKIYLTRIIGKYEADTFISNLDKVLMDYHLIFEEPHPECIFEIWKRDISFTDDGYLE